jgi:hypothetical protein
MLLIAEFAINNSLSSTLNVSPAYALIGYNSSLHTDSARSEPLKGEVLAVEERVEYIYDVYITLIEQ